MGSAEFSFDALKKAMREVRAIQYKYRQQCEETLSQSTPCPECHKRVRLSEDGYAMEMCDTYYRALLQDPRVTVCYEGDMRIQFMGYRISLAPCVPTMPMLSTVIAAAQPAPT